MPGSTVGTYITNNLGLNFSTHAGRPYRGSIGFQGGEFWNGHKKTLTLSTTLRFSKHFHFYGYLTHNRVELAATRLLRSGSSSTIWWVRNSNSANNTWR